MNLLNIVAIVLVMIVIIMIIAIRVYKKIWYNKGYCNNCGDYLSFNIERVSTGNGGSYSMYIFKCDKCGNSKQLPYKYILKHKYYSCSEKGKKDEYIVEQIQIIIRAYEANATISTKEVLSEAHKITGVFIKNKYIEKAFDDMEWHGYINHIGGHSYRRSSKGIKK